MSRHSAAPWHINPNGDAFNIVADDEAMLVARFGAMTRECFEANVRLMAAAPALLEALEDALAWIRDAGGSDAGDETTERIAAALAAATGEMGL